MAYSFVPSTHTSDGNHLIGTGRLAPNRVTGRVTHINWPHRWFQVTYEVNGHKLRQCIKF